MMKLTVSILSIILISSLVIMPLSVKDSSAFVPINPDSEVIYYKIVFSTTWTSCSENNHTSASFYNSVVAQYLVKYDLVPISLPTECVNYRQLDNVIDSNPKDVLIIVIPDLLNSIYYSYNTGNLGHWTFDNGKNVIVSNALSIFPESKHSAWTLSHELSHYVLNLKGFEPIIYVDWVHDVQNQFWNCYSSFSYLQQCPDIYTTVNSPTYNNVQYPVMKIHQEPIKEKITTPTMTTKGITQSKQINPQPSLILSIPDGYDSTVSKDNGYCLLIESATPNIPIRLTMSYYGYDSNYSTDEYFKLNSIGNHYYCATWEYESHVKMLAMAVFDGSSKYDSAYSNIIQINDIEPMMELTSR
jgi:hypothetical protein